MQTRLTDRSLRTLAAPPGKYVEHWDTTFHAPGASFGVRVSGTTGAKSWTFIYRRDGRERRMTLGTYPPLSLADARAKAYKVAADVLANEADPAELRRARRSAPTFGEIVERFLRQYPTEANLRPSTRRDYERVLRGVTPPPNGKPRRGPKPSVAPLVERWGERKAAEITRRDVIGLLDEIAIERGAPIQANRTRALLSKLFGWAVERDLLPASPCASLPRRRKELKRSRVLTDDEIRRLWRALDDEQPTTAGLFRLMLLTAQRGGEVRELRWDEIEGDVWTIPAERAKNREAHAVPLSPQALAVLDALRPVSRDSKYAFPSPHGKGPVRWLSHASPRIAERANLDDFRPHDLRRSAATIMARLGVDRETIRRVLNHKDSGVIAIYDRYQRWPERVAALSRWGAHVEAVCAASTLELPEKRAI